MRKETGCLLHVYECRRFCVFATRFNREKKAHNKHFSPVQVRRMFQFDDFINAILRAHSSLIYCCHILFHFLLILKLLLFLYLLFRLYLLIGRHHTLDLINISDILPNSEWGRSYGVFCLVAAADRNDCGGFLKRCAS